jgi:hypothetical protein
MNIQRLSRSPRLFTILKNLSWIFVFIFTILIFQENIISSSPRDFFNQFQIDSESLVLNSILVDSRGLKYGIVLPNISIDELIFNVNNYIQISGDDLRFYESQLGFLGIFWSYIYNNIFGFKLSLYSLHLINSALTAIMVLVISTIIYKNFNKYYGIIVYLTFILSPWFVASARNLYLSLWLWLLPLVLIYLYSKSKKFQEIYLFIFMIILSLKLSSGFEQTSVYLLLPLFFLFIINFYNLNKSFVKKFIVVACLEIITFLIVFFLFALKRAEGKFIDGIILVLTENVSHRTYGDPSKYNSVFSESLKASPLEVVKTYVFDWQTRVLQFQIFDIPQLSVGKSTFLILTALSVYSLVIIFYLNREDFFRFFILFFFSLSIPLSWFVLGKSHSFIHTHILFLLWYFFYIPTIFFIPTQLVRIIKRRNIPDKITA